MQVTEKHTIRAEHVGHELIARHVNESTTKTEVRQQQKHSTQDVIDTIESLLMPTKNVKSATLTTSIIH